MSMRDYAFYDYGIVLNGLGCTKGKHPDFDENCLEEMAESEVVEHQFSFTGEAFPLDDNGLCDYGHGDSFDDECVYYIASRKHGTIFTRAYSGMKELMDELCTSYRAARKADGRLPYLTRAEIRERLRYITGTYYG